MTSKLLHKQDGDQEKNLNTALGSLQSVVLDVGLQVSLEHILDIA